MLAVQGFGGTEIHRDAVLNHPISFQNQIERLQRSTAVYHEVFGNDLEPADDGFLLKDVLVVRNTQTNADAIIGVAVKPVPRHESRLRMGESPWNQNWRTGGFARPALHLPQHVYYDAAFSLHGPLPLQPAA